MLNPKIEMLNDFKGVWVMVQNIEENIHLPDLIFSKLCLERYKINRGIYNTIDSWFFERGIKDILQRRKKTIYFLEHVIRENKVDNTGNGTKYFKFGHGNLSLELSDFSVHF